MTDWYDYAAAWIAIGLDALCWAMLAPAASLWGYQWFVGVPLAPWTVRSWSHGIARLPWLIPVYVAYRVARWVLRGREWAAVRAVVYVTAVPTVVAYAHKLAHYAGRMAAGESWADAVTHRFEPSLSASQLRVAARMNVDDLVVGYTPYTSAGLALDWAHWQLGAFLSLRYLVVALVAYGVLRVVAAGHRRASRMAAERRAARFMATTTTVPHRPHGKTDDIG